ncbi:MAG: ribosome silencing factor [Phycisphaerae bacterium]
MADGDSRSFAIELARIVSDHKSEDTLILDLRGLSSVTDVVVICTGTSDRQMRAVADHVVDYGRKVGEKPYGFCGYETAAWIVVDFVDVVLHIFAKPFRDYYDLELLWGDAPRIDWARSESA